MRAARVLATLGRFSDLASPSSKTSFRGSPCQEGGDRRLLAYYIDRFLALCSVKAKIALFGTLELFVINTFLKTRSRERRIPLCRVTPID